MSRRAAVASRGGQERGPGGGGTVRRRGSQRFTGHQRGRLRSLQCASVCLWAGPVGARSLGGSGTVCGRERGLDGVGCALARGLPLCHAYSD